MHLRVLGLHILLQEFVKLFVEAAGAIGCSKNLLSLLLVALPIMGQRLFLLSEFLCWLLEKEYENIHFAMLCNDLHHVIGCFVYLEMLVSDSLSVIAFCRKWDIGLAVICPEAPLIAGPATDLNEAGILAFGPSSKAAALEDSKDFMKRFCSKYDIPTAKVNFFVDLMLNLYIFVQLWLEEPIERAYRAVDQIDWLEGFCRRDIKFLHLLFPFFVFSIPKPCFP